MLLTLPTNTVRDSVGGSLSRVASSRWVGIYKWSILRDTYLKYTQYIEGILKSMQCEQGDPVDISD